MSEADWTFVIILIGGIGMCIGYIIGISDAARMAMRYDKTKRSAQ